MFDQKKHSDVYEYFKRMNPESSISRAMFYSYLKQLNYELTKMIIEGMCFRVGNNLGYIYVQKSDRNFKYKTINWGATNKLKKQGINKLIYYTTDTVYRIVWKRISTKKIYKLLGLDGNREVDKYMCYDFKPTSGVGSFKRRVAKAIHEDPMAQTRFIPKTYDQSLKQS